MSCHSMREIARQASSESSLEASSETSSEASRDAMIETSFQVLVQLSVHRLLKRSRHRFAHCSAQASRQNLLQASSKASTRASIQVSFQASGQTSIYSLVKYFFDCCLLGSLRSAPPTGELCLGLCPDPYIWVASGSNRHLDFGPRRVARHARDGPPRQLDRGVSARYTRPS